MTAAPPNDLRKLATLAGIAVNWEDFRGTRHEVQPDILRRLLAALDLPCDTAGDFADSRQRLAAASTQAGLPPLLTTLQGTPTPLRPNIAQAGSLFRLTLESGRCIEGRLQDHAAGGALPPLEEPGYHRLTMDDGATTTLAVAPQRCTSVDELRGEKTGRAWGVAAQLYGLRTKGDGGIGTYGALGRLAGRLAADGADAVAVSPVHALFSAEPGHRSPYSPSSRLLLNALHIDPREAFDSAAMDAAGALDLQSELDRLESSALIDWKIAGKARLAQLRWLHDRVLPTMPGLQAEFERHRLATGGALADHARFEVLHAYFLEQGLWSWREWPSAFRDPGSPAVLAFAREHADGVRFHEVLQWLAARGLRRAQSSARASGMSIGLIADLAVGSDPNGSHAWSRQRETLVGASIGAPPDELAANGQVWGLAALSPTAMRDGGFNAFIELLRANMANAGGIRIDHVLGLNRLWMVPDGASPLEGAYLAYPREDLLRMVALESWRHRCVVIGEDLGTVPPGFRDDLRDREVLGMSVLWFERGDAGNFLPGREWRRTSVAMTTTHDLPTSAGWWLGHDIEVRRDLGIVPSDAEARDQLKQRGSERNALWQAMHADADPVPAAPSANEAPAFVDAAIRHVGRSAAALAVIPLEDVFALVEAPNVPGTSDEHPNWRRRLPSDLDGMLDAPAVRQRLVRLAEARGDAT